MPQLETKDGDIFYEIKGKGKPLILIYGISRSQQYWLGFDDLLAEHFQVITLDLRGIGKSPAKVSWFLSIKDLADDVAQIIKELSLEKPHILGTSLGGMVALSLGFHHSQEVGKLILINTSIGGTKHMRMSWSGMQTMVKAALSKKTIEPLIDMLLAQDIKKEIKNSIFTAWHKIEASEKISNIVTSKQLLAAMRFKPPHKNIPEHFPHSLIVGGLDDRFVPTSNSYAVYKMLPNSQIKLLPDVGHEIHAEKPEILKNLVVEFLSQ